MPSSGTIGKAAAIAALTAGTGGTAGLIWKFAPSVLGVFRRRRNGDRRRIGYTPPEHLGAEPYEPYVPPRPEPRPRYEQRPAPPPRVEPELPPRIVPAGQYDMQPSSVYHEYQGAPSPVHHVHYPQLPVDDEALRLRKAMALYSRNNPGAGATMRAVEDIYRVMKSGER